MTATTFVGAVTGNVTGNATGLSGTPNISVGTISGSTGTFSGAIDANGDLDVDGHTELDNVNIAGVVTATTFKGAVQATSGTFSSNVNVGTGVTIETNGQATYTGIVTASKFVGDGSSLTGISGGGGSIGIQSAGALVGTATTINFTAGSVSVSNNIASVSVG